MSNLAEIKVATEALPLVEKQELLLFLAERLRGQDLPLPEPQTFSREQVSG